MEVKAQAMGSETGDVRESIGQEKNEDLMGTSSESIQDRSGAVVQDIETLSENDAGAAQDPNLEGGEPSASGLPTDDMVSPPGQEQQPTAADGVQKVDDFSAKLGVAKDEVGEFRTPSLHASQITPLEEPTAADQNQAVWGDGPAPPGSLSRTDDDPPKTRLDETITLIQPADSEDDSSDPDPDKLSQLKDQLDSLTNHQEAQRDSISKLREQMEEVRQETVETSPLSSNREFSLEESVQVAGAATIDFTGLSSGEGQSQLSKEGTSTLTYDSSTQTGTSPEGPGTGDVDIDVDQAQLDNIDLQNMLQKQQQNIQMMSNLSKIMHDTALAVSRKMSGSGSDSSSSNGPSSDGSVGEGNTQHEAEATDLVRAVIVGEASADINPALQDAMLAALAESGQDVQDLAEKIANANEMKNDLREEANNLRDELQEWPDGETREITITTWEKGEDGTYVKVEKTVTISKEEARTLFENMEEGSENANVRGGSEEVETPYQLVEGTILVSEALIESAPAITDGDEEQGDTSGRIEFVKELLAKLNELGAELKEHRIILAKAREEISLLRDELSDWPDGDDTQTITYRDVEKQADDSFQIVDKTETMTKDQLENQIHSLEESVNHIDDYINDLLEQIKELGTTISNAQTDLGTLGFSSEIEEKLQGLDDDIGAGAGNNEGPGPTGG